MHLADAGFPITSSWINRNWSCLASYNKWLKE